MTGQCPGCGGPTSVSTLDYSVRIMDNAGRVWHKFCAGLMLAGIPAKVVRK